MDKNNKNLLAGATSLKDKGNRRWILAELDRLTTEIMRQIIDRNCFAKFHRIIFRLQIKKHNRGGAKVAFVHWRPTSAMARRLKVSPSKMLSFYNKNFDLILDIVRDETPEHLGWILDQVIWAKKVNEEQIILYHQLVASDKLVQSDEQNTTLVEKINSMRVLNPGDRDFVHVWDMYKERHNLK